MILYKRYLPVRRLFRSQFRWVVLLIFVQLFACSHTASAHATLINSDPAEASVLESAPNQVVLWYSEAIVPRFTAIRLINSEDTVITGASVDLDLSDENTIYITLPALEKGSYLLFWKVLSNEDGHFSQGISTFNVGVAGSGKTAAAVTTSLLPSAAETILRWLHLLLITSAIGAVIMVYGVLSPVASQGDDAAMAAQERLRSRVLRWAAACAGSALLVGFGLLWWQVILASDPTAPTTPWFAQSSQLLTQTLWGMLWLVRQVILLLFALGLWFLAGRKQGTVSTSLQLLITGRAIDLLVVQALSSHQISSSDNWPLMLTNVSMHLLAASIWMGGMLVLALRVMPFVQHPQTSSLAGWQPLRWRSFSLLAACSVGLLFASGLYSMSNQVASLDALLTTTYGQLLTGKIALVLLAGLCGLGNMRAVHPGFASWLTSKFRRSVNHQPLRQTQAWRFSPLMQLSPRLLRLEALLGMLILGASALLAASAPPIDVAYTIDPKAIQPMLGQRVDGMLLSLEASPNRLGQNLFSIRNLSASGTEQSPILTVLLTFTYLGKTSTAIKPVSVLADNVEENLFQVNGNYFRRPGNWQIDVQLTRLNLSDTVATFRWIVPPTGTVAPVFISKAPWRATLSLLSFLLLGGIFVAALALRWQWKSIQAILKQ